MAWDNRQRDEYLQQILPGGIEALKRLIPTKFAALQQEAQRRNINEFQVLAQLDPAKCEALFTGTQSARFTMNQSPPQPAQAYVPGGTQNAPMNPYANAPPAPIPLPAHPTGLQEKIANYDVWVELGKGGMGRAVLAYDPKLKRQVVIKTMLGAGDTEAKLRFKREGETLARINHENVVRVYDAGLDGTQMYIAMESITGAKDLRKSMPGIIGAEERWTKTAEIMRGAARGIAAAHEQKILHRDLKPDNILLTAKGVPKVIDFGLAKDKISDAGLTLDDTIMGTPEYMPPEQISGLTREIDERSDVYSLGAILYELLAVSRPYAGRNMIELAQQITDGNKTPPRPTSIDKSVPLALETIALKALSKKKEDRYQTATELAEDLERYLNDEPILAMPEGLGKRAVRAVKLHKAPILAGLATLAGVYAGIASYRAQGAELQTTKEREGRIAAEAAATKTLADAEADRQNRQYEFHITQAREAADAGRLEEAGRHMGTARTLRPNDRRPEIIALENFIGGDRTVSIAPINSNPIYWQISEMTRNGEVKIADSRSTGPVNVTLKHGRFYNLEAAPEGRMEYRHLFRMDNQRQIRLRAEQRIEGQVTVDGRARPLPELYLIANDTRDFYFSAVPTSIGQYVLFLKDRGIDVTDRNNELRPRFVSNNQSLPLTQMNVRQAQAYCDWLTEKIEANGFRGYRARLPTPAEVELAAAPHSGWTYPWGYNVNPTNNDGTITNVYDASTLQRALEGGGVEGLLRPLTISDNLLGVAASRAKHWGNIRRLAIENGRVYAVGASFMENDETLQQFRRDNQGASLYRRQMTENQPDAATGFSVVVERTR